MYYVSSQWAPWKQIMVSPAGIVWRPWEGVVCFGSEWCRMSHRHLMTLLKSIDPSDPDFFSYLTFFLSLFTLSHSLFSLLSLSLSFSLTPPPLSLTLTECLAYSCFTQLMKRMSQNFPNGGRAMDTHFANMRSLIQVSVPFKHSPLCLG